jgi:hypothetical protein
MVFWRIEELKRQLRNGPLPQRAAFGYTLLIWILWEAVAGAPRVFDGPADPVTAGHWAMYLGGIATIAVAIYAAYRANGGSRGRDFAARFLALAFVVGLRVLVLVIIPVMLVLALAGAAIEAQSPGFRTSSMFLWIQATVAFLLAYVFFATRLVAHFRDVAAASSGYAAG